jgi:hypothetical protein
MSWDKIYYEAGQDNGRNNRRCQADPLFTKFSAFAVVAVILG